jgi:PiT family inorganic phosphate transporter
MGIVTLTLIASGSLAAGSGPPVWVIISAGIAITAGTYLGGWRITQTLGKKLTTIEAPQGFAAQTSSAAVILASSHVGFALSTTHVCSGGVMGSGLGREPAGVHWNVFGRMVLAWVVTLPAAGLVGALAGTVAAHGTVGVLSVAAVGVLVSLGIYFASRRRPVRPEHVVDEIAPQVEEHSIQAAA